MNLKSQKQAFIINNLIKIISIQIVLFIPQLHQEIHRGQGKDSHQLVSTDSEGPKLSSHPCSCYHPSRLKMRQYFHNRNNWPLETWRFRPGYFQKGIFCQKCYWYVLLFIFPLMIYHNFF